MSDTEDKLIFKAGTKIWLGCSTHDRDSQEFEEITLDVDMTSDEITELAREFFYNQKEPEWWFSETKPKPGLWD